MRSIKAFLFFVVFVFVLFSSHTIFAATYNAGIPLAGFIEQECRVGLNMRPYVIAYNIEDTGLYKVKLEVYKDKLGLNGDPVFTEIAGPMEIEKGETYSLYSEFAPESEGKYYVKATVLSINDQEMSGDSSNPNPYESPNTVVSNDEFGSITAIAPQDTEWTEFTEGVASVIEVTVKNQGEAGQLSVVPTGLPADWVLNDYVLRHTFEQGESYTFQFRLTPYSAKSADIWWKVVYEEQVVTDDRKITITANAAEQHVGPQGLMLSNGNKQVKLTVDGKGLVKRSAPPTIAWGDWGNIGSITAQVDGKYLSREIAADLFFRTTYQDPLPLYEHIGKSRIRDIAISSRSNAGGGAFSIKTFDPMTSLEMTSMLSYCYMLGIPFKVIDSYAHISGGVKSFSKRKVAYKNLLTSAAGLTHFYKEYPEYIRSATDTFADMVKDNKHVFSSLGLTVTGDPVVDLRMIVDNQEALGSAQTFSKLGNLGSMISGLTSIQGGVLKGGVLNSRTLSAAAATLDAISIGVTASSNWGDRKRVKDYTELIFASLLRGGDSGNRIRELKKLRDASADIAFKEAYDETLANAGESLTATYQTVLGEIQDAVQMGLNVASFLNNIAGFFPPAAPVTAVLSCVIWGAQETLGVDSYLDSQDLSWVDSQLSCGLRNIIHDKLAVLSDSMDSEPQPLDSYDQIKTLMSIYYFLGFRDAKIHKELCGVDPDAASFTVQMGMLLGTVAHDNTRLNQIEGDYATYLSGAVRSTQYMSRILAKSYGDSDGDGKHDLEDKFATDPLYWEDIDQDGLPDDWERRVFGSTLVADGTGDQDQDAIIDAEEFKLETNPLVKSTRTKVPGVRVGVYTSVSGEARTRITWTPLQVAGLTYNVLRLSGSSLIQVATGITEFAYVENRNDLSDIYYVVAVTSEGLEGPRVEARRQDYATSSFSPTPLTALNTASPGGHVQLYGVIADPDTGFLIEEGDIAIYGTTGNFTGHIIDGRVRMVATAPAESDSWTVVLQTDGSTRQLEPVSIPVASGSTVKNVTTSSGVGYARVNYHKNGYDYAKVEAGLAGGSLQVVQETNDSTYTASQFQPGQLIEFRVIPYNLVPDGSGGYNRDYGSPISIKERIGWGGQLLEDATIPWASVDGQKEYPQKVCSTITVPAGLSLTVESGAWVQFIGSSTSLIVSGTLSADGGDEQNKIYFTSSSVTPAGGDWGRIHFNGGSNGVLKHAVIEYAGYYIDSRTYGYNGAAICAHGGTVSVDNVAIRHIVNPYSGNVAYGVWIKNAPKLGVTNCEFNDIEHWAILDQSSGNVTIAENRISDCSVGGISSTNQNGSITANEIVTSGYDGAVYYTGAISKDTVWDRDVRFGAVTVNAGVTLTILPGVTCFGHDRNAQLVVDGTLKAEGTVSQPITFTSPQSTPAGGDWGRIWFNDGSTGVLKHAVIEYAGYYIDSRTYGYNGAAICAHGGTVSVDNVAIRHIVNPYSGNVAYGVWIKNAPKLGVTNCEFNDIEHWAILDQSSGNVTIAENRISDCSVGGISSTNQNGSITANEIVTSGYDGAVYYTGAISKDTVWDRDVRFGAVTVNAGVTLTILPGVTCFGHDRNAQLVVDGTLKAEGTVSQPITFTSPQSTPAGGDWGRIWFNDGSTGVLKHAVIEYAGYYIDSRTYGYNGAAICAHGGTVSIDNVAIRHIVNPYSGNIAYGVWVKNAPKLGVTNCEFNDIEHWAILDQSSGNVTIAENRISDCSVGGISSTNQNGLITANEIVTSGYDGAVYYTGAITKDTVWDRDVRFGAVTVNAGVTLTILPGVTCFGHDKNAQLLIDGTLKAEGTVSQPITFTSPQSTPAGGDWGRIWFNDGSTGVLKHAVIEYAGYYIDSRTYGYNGAAICAYGGTVSVDNVAIRHIVNPYSGNVAYGIWIKNTPELKVTKSTIENVESWAIRNDSATAELDLRYSIIRNNGYGIYSATAEIDARLVDWGTVSGPKHTTLNTAGEGNEVQGNVLFEPWLHMASTYETFESGSWDGDFSWLTSGNGDWVLSDQAPINGNFSAKSPIISNGQQATVKAVVPCREGYVSFRYAVVSEVNADFLKFYIDGKLVSSWSGTVSDSTTPISDDYKVAEGVHTFEWVWTKNDSASAGADTAWIDDVVIPRLVGHMEGSVTTDVTGEDQPLIGAKVTLSDGASFFTTTTDENGEYSFYNIPYGDYSLTIEKDDFVTSTQSVAVDSFGVSSITPVAIEGVDTSVLYTPVEVNDEIQRAVDQVTQSMYTKEQLDKAVEDAIANQPAKPKVVVIPMF